MAKLILVNAPAAFTFAWNIAKAWLDPASREKVVILGITADLSNDGSVFMDLLLGTDYRSFLLEHIDEENLPAEYGGTCTCEGLGGCALSNNGPWLEGRASSKNKPNLQQESDEVTSTVGNDKEKVNGSMHEAEAIVVV